MAPTEIGLFCIGLLLGPLINFAIYAFAYFPRPISPWQSLAGVNRSHLARIPILGWLRRWPEVSHFGKWFWVRPFLIELACPFLMLALYRYVMRGNLIPVGGLGVIGETTLFHQFLAIAILISFMVIATFIDFDERTIPDFVTVPGTLIGLFGAVLFPDWRMYEITFPVPPALTGTIEALHAGSPFGWELDWNQNAPGHVGLWIGLFFWSGWCFGMADRRWITRRGLTKACVYFFEALRRSASTVFLIGLWVAGILMIAFAYWFTSATQWESLLSSLFGIGLGGMLIWGFRLVARWAMGQEALGFGDVTLMAMIGSFFGWQIVWISFFLAPFFGLMFVITSWIITRDNATPFGPYLCAAALYTLLAWDRMWEWCSNWFLPTNWILFVLVVLIIAMGVLLAAMRWIKIQVFGNPN